MKIFLRFLSDVKSSFSIFFRFTFLTIIRNLSSVIEFRNMLPNLFKDDLYASLLNARYLYISGKSEEACLILEKIAKKIEQLWYVNNVIANNEGKLLAYVYSNLQAAYLTDSKIEEACILMDRVNKYLELQHLPNNRSFDLRTARIVRSSIATSKLLETEGSASLTFYKLHSEKPRIESKKPPILKLVPSETRHSAIENA